MCCVWTFHKCLQFFKNNPSSWNKRKWKGWLDLGHYFNRDPCVGCLFFFYCTVPLPSKKKWVFLFYKHRIIGCVTKHWSKLLKNISVILKFVVCKSNPDIENVNEENTPLIKEGKNAIPALKYFILWFILVNRYYLMNHWNWEEGFFFCTSKLLLH